MFKYIFNIFAALLAALAPQSAWATADGASLYQRNCAVCHGMNGDGGVGIPLNLKDFQEVASDDYLRVTLRVGRPGRVMPAFPGLTEQQIDAIIEHMRSWSDSQRPT